MSLLLFSSCEPCCIDTVLLIHYPSFYRSSSLLIIIIIIVVVGCFLACAVFPTARESVVFSLREGSFPIRKDPGLAVIRLSRICLFFTCFFFFFVVQRGSFRVAFHSFPHAKRSKVPHIHLLPFIEANRLRAFVISTAPFPLVSLSVFSTSENRKVHLFVWVGSPAIQLLSSIHTRMNSRSRSSRGASPTSARSPSAQNAIDPYQLQTKALDRWEKQRAVWDQLSLSLARRTGTRPNGTTNFTTATGQSREQVEDFGMIQSAVPQAELSNYYAWESLLRCTDAAKAVRFVQIGKAYYPYAIFGEVQDSSSLKPSNPAYARIVRANHSCSLGSEARAEAREALRRKVALGDDKEALHEFAVTEADRDRRKEDYYRNQILKFSQHINKKFSHFLVPRQFLHVEGRPTPRMSEREHDEIEVMEREHPVEPTQYYPPPQNVRLPVVTPMSPNDAIRIQSEQSVMNITNGTNAASPNVSVAVEAADLDSAVRRGPNLVISARRLLFRGYPGELVHGHIRLRNTSSITVYYSWMPVDLISEALRASEGNDAASPAKAGGTSPFTGHPTSLQLPQLADASAKPMTPASAISSESQNGILVGADATVLQHSRKLHTMATRCRRANAYFRLSSPINGVVLPDESELFPFSMRAPHEGCFKHTYELLTIPPSPERILIELCGLVASSEPTAHMLSQPIERVLREKAGMDAQRHLVQSLANASDPYIESDLNREMANILKRKEDEVRAKGELREKQKARWDAYNKHTFDGIPYHPRVYDKLLALFRNLDETMNRLQTPLHHHNWDGSLQYLFVDIHRLRDASSRMILMEGLAVLLRAARVSRDQDGADLQTLLKLAAEALAEHTRNIAVEQLHHEVEFAQYPREPVNVMPIGKPKRGGGGGGNAAGGSAGIRKHTPTGRDKENYVVTGAYRTPAPTMELEEQDLLQAEYDLLLADQLEALKETTELRKERLYQHFQHAVSLACDLPLLDVVQGSRVEDIMKIQHIEEMEVDNGAEMAPPKVGCDGKGKAVAEGVVWRLRVVVGERGDAEPREVLHATPLKIMPFFFPMTFFSYAWLYVLSFSLSDGLLLVNLFIIYYLLFIYFSPCFTVSSTDTNDFREEPSPLERPHDAAAIEESEEFKNRTSEITAFKVYCRVRPFIAEELAEMEGQERRSIVEMSGNRTILLDPKDNWAPKAQYEFDASLWSIPPNHNLVHTFQDTRRKDYSSQRDVYELVAKDLYNPKVPCGGDGPEGIIPRVSNDLFALLAQRQRSEPKPTDGATVKYRVEVSFVEIYMERVRDLLDPALRNAKGSDRLHDARIRQDPYSGPFVEGVTKYQVENWGQCCILLERGSQHRTTCATAVHNQSSRSHAIYQLTVIRETTTPSKGRYDRPTIQTQSGRINLVDLAGSERGGFQEYVKESAAINTSLLALRRCIDCLTERQNMLMEELRAEITEGYRPAERNLPQVPFRDSVLTWLLSDSIGGNARTTMIATLSPLVKNYGDTQATLTWSSKARNLVTLVKVNDQAVVQGGLNSQRGQLGNAVQNVRQTLDSLRETLKKKQSAAEKMARDTESMRQAAISADERTEVMLREMAAIIIQRAYQMYTYRARLRKLKTRHEEMQTMLVKLSDSQGLVKEQGEADRKEAEAKTRLRLAEASTEHAAEEVAAKEASRAELDQRRIDVKARFDRIHQRIATEIQANATDETGKTVAQRIKEEEEKRVAMQEELAKYKAKIAESNTGDWKIKYDTGKDTTAQKEEISELLRQRDALKAEHDAVQAKLRKMNSGADKAETSATRRVVLLHGTCLASSWPWLRVAVALVLVYVYMFCLAAVPSFLKEKYYFPFPFSICLALIRGHRYRMALPSRRRESLSSTYAHTHTHIHTHTSSEGDTVRCPPSPQKVASEETCLSVERKA
eukprot:gene9959-6953_t